MRLCVTGEENSLALAIREPKIIDSDIETLNQALRFVMLKIGLREKNLPSKEEKAVLINHIITNFGQHTCSEIKLAFDMAVSGKLNIEDAKHYENFSCMYFSEIMNAYRLWSKDAYRLLEKELDNSVQKIYSDEEILNQRRSEIECAFQAIKSGKDPLFHMYWYEVLSDDELLPKMGFIPTDEQKKAIVIDFFIRRVSTSKNIYVND